MIPDINILTEDIEEIHHPTQTYKIEVECNCISGYVDDLEAILQTIYLILNTERYEFLIYSWDYGIELADLIGQPMPYVMSELPRRIEEALTQDDRIIEVKDFEFEVDKKMLATSFVVVTESGDIQTDLGVTI